MKLGKTTKEFPVFPTKLPGFPGEFQLKGINEGLSQDLETGCPKLGIRNFRGV